VNPRYPWIVLRDLGELRCERCGKIYQPALPAPINVYLAICKAFTRDHRHCKAKCK
jgi:hypothetical protein